MSNFGFLLTRGKKISTDVYMHTSLPLDSVEYNDISAEERGDDQGLLNNYSLI